jgi:hypothetical protein
MDAKILLPHQERVVTEERELSEKLDALTGFIGGEIFRGLHKVEQERLVRQQQAMACYREVLLERLEGFLVNEKTVEADAIAGELYEVYNKAVGGVAFNGDPLPPWSEFAGDPNKTKQSGGWRAIGERVVELIEKAHHLGTKTSGLKFRMYAPGTMARGAALGAALGGGAAIGDCATGVAPLPMREFEEFGD